MKTTVTPTSARVRQTTTAIADCDVHNAMNQAMRRESALRYHFFSASTRGIGVGVGTAPRVGARLSRHGLVRLAAQRDRKRSVIFLRRRHRPFGATLYRNQLR